MLYFTQPSTRTYLSFENACHLLGIRTAEIRDPSTSSEFKGESFEDSLRTFSSYVDVIIMRARARGSRGTRPISWIASAARCRSSTRAAERTLIPPRPLLDIYTLERSFEARGGIDGKTIGVMGDLKRGRTARSLSYLMERYRDVRLVFVAPDAFQMERELLDWLTGHGVTFSCTDRLHEVLGDLDALYVTRLQKEYDTGGESDGFDHAPLQRGPARARAAAEARHRHAPAAPRPGAGPPRRRRPARDVLAPGAQRHVDPGRAAGEDLRRGGGSARRAASVNAAALAKRYRFPITAIAVVGLGALVATAVGVSLFLGFASSTDNTRRLMALQSETLVDGIEQRLESQLQPVDYRARWMVDQIERGNVKLDDPAALDTFMLGALSAAQRVSGLGIVDPQAQVRGWERPSNQPLVEDWSGTPQVIEWLKDGATRTGPSWQAPSWTPVLEETTVRHDMPIRIDGEFAGMFSQAVSVSDLSRYLAAVGTETGIIPFILYDRDRVLAHPMLMGWTPAAFDQDQPLGGPRRSRRFRARANLDSRP